MESTIHVLSFGLVNAYVIQGEKNILVDTGPPGQFDKLVEKVNACGVAVEDIALIVITHAHGDHYGNVAEFKKRYYIPVAVHSSVFRENEELVQAKAVPKGLLGKLIKLVFGDMKCQSFIPDISVDEQFNLEDYGINGTVVHIPGHTEDSIGFWLNGHQMIVGDTISSRKKRPLKALFLNDIEAYKKSVQKILLYNPTEIYCSHGSVLMSEGIEAIKKWV